ncbi:MAG: NAD(P)-binding domain-containing protein, partial [Acidobacteria bacterium]|nr:NAD(P)-binding domain-containing protein [Acidobacteriota bacterium]
MKIGFVGGGKMAEALIGVLLARKLAAPDEVIVGEPLPGRRQALAEAHRVQVTADNRKAVAGADIVVLAVKPNQFGGVAASLKRHLESTQTVVSIMAGITVKRLRDELQHAAVVRVMPNP